MAQPLSLDVYKGEQLVASQTYEREIIKIGRLSSAHLRLEDDKVSRIHSVVEVDPEGQVSITDMGSAVGTLVNGQRVNKGPLAHGDEIRLGDTRIVVRLQAAAAQADPAPAAPAAESAAPQAPAAAPPAPEAAQTTTPAQPAPSVQPAPAAPAPEGSVPSAPREQLAATEAPQPPPPAEPAASAENVPPAPPAGSTTEDVPPAAPAASAPTASGPSATPGTSAAAAYAPEGEPRAERPEAEPRADIPDPGFGREVPTPDPYDGADFVSAPVDPGSVPSADQRAVEVRLMWGRVLIKAEHFVKRKRITIGESGKASFFLHADDFPGHEFPLVRFDGADYVLSFTERMNGRVHLDGRTWTLKELIGAKKATPVDDETYELPLPPESRAALVFGGATVLIRFVTPPSKVVVPFAEHLDYQFLNTLLLTLFLHLAFLVTAYNYPLNTDLVQDDLFKSPNRFAKFILKAPEPVQNTRLTRLLDAMSKKPDPGEAAAKHEGEEGKMGRKDAPERKTRSAPKAIDVSDMNVIANQGVFKMLENGGSAGISTVFGKGGLGGDLHGALGGLVGSEVGDAKGLGGLGLKGSGSGGGGLSGSTIGVGGIGTKGRGGGVGTYGTGVAGLGKKRDSNIAIQTGDPVVMGSLDKELIRRVIQSHRAQIRYCYEKELQATPGLYGKITVKFTISASGRVSAGSIDGTTMNNRGVESCLVSRVKTWQFPKPKGGGIVIVTYPFVFKQGG